MTDDFDPLTLNDHQRALLAQTSEFQKLWFEKRLTPAQKAEVMALHTGNEPESDRPLLKKPLPDYVSSREMLYVLWRKSEWKPDPDFDYGLDHEINENPEMLDFMNWVVVLMKIGRLQAYAQTEVDDFREAKIADFADAMIHGALLKGNRVACDVRVAVTDENAFQRNILPMLPAHCALWFRKCDVEDLVCDETATEHDLEQVKSLGAHASIAAAIEANRQPRNAIATTRPDPVTATAGGIGSTATIGQARATIFPTAEGIGSTVHCGAERAPVPTVEAARNTTLETVSKTSARINTKRAAVAPFIRQVFDAHIAARSGRYKTLGKMCEAIAKALPDNLSDIDNRTIIRAAAEDEAWKQVSPPTLKKRNRHPDLS